MTFPMLGPVLPKSGTLPAVGADPKSLRRSDLWDTGSDWLIYDGSGAELYGAPCRR